MSKVISGGQTGVDQAALRAARDCGLETGGWCPPGRESEAGIIPAEFPLKETKRERSPRAPDVPRSQRTEWNVRDADGTLIIAANGASHSEAATEDGGTRWAIECARRYGKSLLICGVADPDAKEKIGAWLSANPIEILNVAGPSESTEPGIAEKAYAVVARVFRCSGGL